MTLPIDLVLVRHGESEGNAAKRLLEKGQPETLKKLAGKRHTSGFLLTPLGEKQAEAAGAWLRDAFPGGFERYYVSEYRRAKQTAGLMALPGSRWYTNPYLCERDSGHVEMPRPGDVHDEDYLTMLRMRTIEPFFWKPGAGESLAELSLRLDRVLDTLHRLKTGNGVIMVCHGEVMWTYRVLLERMSQESFRETYLSKDPLSRIHNCQVMHYTRRNPEHPDAEPEPYLQWMRAVRPTETPVWTSGWRRIERSSYTNEQLLEEIERYRSSLNHDPQ